MDARNRLIIIGGIILLLIAIALGIVFSLGRLPKSGPSTDSNTPLSRLPVISTPSASPVENDSRGNGNTKTFVGEGFSLSYPSNWGILTCANSNNFEFDPVNSTDVKNVVCDIALKPVTVLSVNRLNCQGDSITLGNNRVTKSKVTAANGDVRYRWCVPVGNKGLDITHRVSSSGTRATSTQDFSGEIEKIIMTINITPRGS